MNLKNTVGRKAKPANPVSVLVNRDLKTCLPKKIRTAAMMACILFSLFIILCAPARVYAVWACNPVSATLCAAVDDNAWIYLNGTLLDTFPYCDIQWACSIKCINLNPAQLSLLLPTGNVLATYVQNTNCCEVWGSWSMDITCSDGSQAISSSDSVGVKMYNDQTCMTAPTPNPSPTPQGGYQWYQPLYPLDANWKNPIEMTGWKWGKRLYDPATGDLLAALSYAATMSTDCGAIWFRVPFTLTPVPTPMPPIFSIIKSYTPATHNNAPVNLTFTLHICNTGGGTKGVPLNVIDTWVPAGGDSWRFGGFIYGGSNPYSYSDPVYGQVERVGGDNSPVTFRFDDGFNSNSCVDLMFQLIADNPVTVCGLWPNIAALSYTPQPTLTAVSSVQIKNFCPSPTVTPTVTPTAATPILSISKTANPNTGITGNQQINFTLIMCNTGGYILDSLYVSDDWNSPDNIWNDNTPWAAPVYPMTAIAHGKPATYTFGTGFPANTCITWNMSIISYGPISPVNYCATWQNTASIFYRTTPAITGVANLVNFCPSATVTKTITPTSTKTNTPLPGTLTFTPTFTGTPTKTQTWTNSPTPIPGSPTNTPTKTMTVTVTVTVTSTPPSMVIQLTKTVPKNIYLLGDTITYCLTFTNNGTGPATFTIWDTIPAVTDYVGCDNGSKGYATGCGSLTFGPNVLALWNVANVPIGGFDTVCVYVQVNRLPYLILHKEFFALLEDREYPVFAGKAGVIGRGYMGSGQDYFLKTP